MLQSPESEQPGSVQSNPTAELAKEMTEVLR